VSESTGPTARAAEDLHGPGHETDPSTQAVDPSSGGGVGRATVVRRTVLGVGAAILVAAAAAVAIDEPPPPPVRAPDGSIVLFADSFDDDDWCDYHRVQNRYYSDPACDYDNDSYALREDDGAARFEVRPGDAGGGGLGGGERSEISQDSASWQASPGDEWVVQMRLRLSEDFRPGRWTILTQFHSGEGSPPLCLKVDDDGALVLDSAGHAGDTNREAGKKDRELVPAESFMDMRGEWFDVELHVRWSNRVAEGGTEVSINGELVAPWRSQRTMLGDRIYWKGGIYRAPTNSTHVLWMDDLRITTPSPGSR
jgi:Polysaccharide lyase